MANAFGDYLKVYKKKKDKEKDQKITNPGTLADNLDNSNKIRSNNAPVNTKAIQQRLTSPSYQSSGTNHTLGDSAVKTKIAATANEPTKKLVNAVAGAIQGTAGTIGSASKISSFMNKGGIQGNTDYDFVKSKSSHGDALKTLLQLGDAVGNIKNGMNPFDVGSMMDVYNSVFHPSEKGTIGDLGSAVYNNSTGELLQNVQNILGLGSSAVKKVFGDEAVNNVGQNLEDLNQNTLGKAQQAMNDYSRKFMYKPEDKDSQFWNNIGSNAANAGLGLATGSEGIALGAMGMSAANNAYEQAIAEGASPTDAMNYANQIAATEVGTELLSPGVPGMSKVNLAGEGMEEYLSGIIEPLQEDVYKKPEETNLLKRELALQPSALEQGAEGILSAGVLDLMNGGQSIRQIPGELQNSISNDEFMAKKAANAAKDIYNNMIGNDTSTDLGAAGYHQENASQIKMMQDQVNFMKTLPQTTAVKQDIQTLQSGIDRMKVGASAQQANTLSSQIQAKGNAEYRANKALLNTDTLKSNDMMIRQNAQELNSMQIRNSGNRYGVSPAAVNQVERLSNKLGIVTKFVDTITDENGNSANGRYSDGVIEISSKASNPALTVFAHELTHYAENGASYKDLQNALYQAYSDGHLVKGKSQLKTALEYVAKNYQTNDQKVINSETTAMLAENLFSDEKAIKNLCRDNYTVGQRIYNWISDIASRTKDKELFNAKKYFENALKESSYASSLNSTLDNQYQYSTAKSWRETIIDAAKGNLNSKQNALLMNQHTNIVLQQYANMDDLPMLMTSNHVKDALGLGKGWHQHEMSQQNMIDLPNLLDDPIAVYRNGNAVCAFLKDTDSKGHVILVAIQPNGIGHYNNVSIMSNFVLSAYGKENVVRYIDKKLNNNDILYPAGTNKNQILQNILRLQSPNSTLVSGNFNITNSIDKSSGQHSLGLSASEIQENTNDLINTIKDVGGNVDKDGDYSKGVSAADVQEDTIRTKEQLTSRIANYDKLNTETAANMFGHEDQQMNSYLDVATKNIIENGKISDTVREMIISKITNEGGIEQGKFSKSSKYSDFMSKESIRDLANNELAEYEDEVKARLNAANNKRKAGRLSQSLQNNKILGANVDSFKEIQAAADAGAVIQPGSYDANLKSRLLQPSEARMKAKQAVEDIRTLAYTGLNYGDIAKTIEQNGDVVTSRNKETRIAWKRLFEDPMYQAKSNYVNDYKSMVQKVTDIIKETGIKAGSKESEALQWYAEKQRMKQTSTQKSTNIEYEAYTIDDLKKDFPNNWQKIVTAEKSVRTIYDEMYSKVNASLEKIYPEAQIVDEIQKIRNKTENQIAEKQALLEKLQAQGPLADVEQVKKLQTELRKLSHEYNDAERTARKNKRLDYRKDYITHMREVAPGRQSFFSQVRDIVKGPSNISNELSGLSEWTKPNTKWEGLMQRRNGGRYQADAIGALLNYLPRAEYKAYIDPYTAYLRGVITEYKKASDDIGNDNTALIRYLSNYTNDLAGKTNPIDRGLDNFTVGKVDGRKALRILRTLNSRSKANAVVGNINSAITQIYNLPNAMAVLQEKGGIGSTADWAKGLKEYSQDNIQKWSHGGTRMCDQSVFLSERYFDSNYTDKLDTSLKWYNKGASWMLEVGDRTVAEQTWYAAYEQGKRLNVENPSQYADELVRRSVAGRGIGEVPLTQKSEIIKLLMPFQVEVNNSWQLMEHQFGEKKAASMMTMFIAMFLLNGIKKKIFGTDGTGFDPVNDYLEAYKNSNGNMMDTAGRTLAYTTGDLIANIPGGNYAAELAGQNSYTLQKMFGEHDPTRYGVGNMGLQSYIQPVMDYANGKNVDYLKFFSNVGLPGGGKQAERTIKYLQDAGIAPRMELKRQENNLLPDLNAMKPEWKKGKYSTNGQLQYANNGNLISDLRGITFGTGATDKGQEYKEAGYSALGDNATATYESMVKAGGKAGDVYQSLRDAQQLESGVDYPEGTNNAQSLAARAIFVKNGTWESLKAAYNQDPDAVGKGSKISKKVFAMSDAQFQSEYKKVIGDFAPGTEQKAAETPDTSEEAAQPTPTTQPNETNLAITANIEPYYYSDGSTIRNSKALLARQALENEGKYEEVLQEIADGKATYEDYNLTKKVAKMSEAGYQKYLQNCYNLNGKEKKSSSTSSNKSSSNKTASTGSSALKIAGSSKKTASTKTESNKSTAQEIYNKIVTAATKSTNKTTISKLKTTISTIKSTDLKLYNEIVSNHDKKMKELGLL